MADQIRVFVSHHHSPEEDAFTAQLVTGLEAVGADVWVDTAGITSDDFVKKISEGLAGRQWLILVMTPAALASPWVQREVNAALNEHTAGRMLGVLLLVMQPCREQDMPFLWRPLHRYDATRNYQGAVSGLVRALGLQIPPPLPRPQSVPPPRPPASPAPVVAPDLLPPRLAQLGFAAFRFGTIEYIIPPLCEVPPGDCLLGSDPKKDGGARDDEQPQHRVYLLDFRIGRYPVTVAEYTCFLHTRLRQPAKWLAQQPEHPVVSVSWHDAVAYVAWLTKVTGQLWRLPSEAEWEKAARWDVATRMASIYPWGDSFDQTRCNTSAGGKGTTTPVGSYPSGASPCGAQDMAGNVWEWTSSFEWTYPNPEGREWLDDAATDASGPDASGHRVLRGGSWVDLAENAGTACRAGSPPDAVSVLNGFRVVRAVFG